MAKPKLLSVTEQSIDLSSLTPETWRYFEELADSICDRYHSIGKSRAIFALTGPGGAGKSVISAILENLLNQRGREFAFYNVSVDAYHFPNNTLESEGLLSVKGRYDTYDISALRSDISLFKSGRDLQFPTYSRQLHEPIPKSLNCSSQKAILWLEGGWLLYPESGWGELIPLFDHSYFIHATETDVEAYIIRRHVQGGREIAEAQQFYTQSDSKNIQLVLEKSLPANENIIFWQNLQKRGN